MVSVVWGPDAAEVRALVRQLLAEVEFGDIGHFHRMRRFVDLDWSPQSCFFEPRTRRADRCSSCAGAHRGQRAAGLPFSPCIAGAGNYR